MPMRARGDGHTDGTLAALDCGTFRETLQRERERESVMADACDFVGVAWKCNILIDTEPKRNLTEHRSSEAVRRTGVGRVPCPWAAC